jgi:hypothetical protein
VGKLEKQDKWEYISNFIFLDETGRFQPEYYMSFDVLTNSLVGDEIMDSSLKHISANSMYIPFDFTLTIETRKIYL